MEAFKISLAAARVNAKLTQSEAAKQLGINKNTLANWESGATSPRASQVDALCKLYNVPSNFLCF